MSHRGSGHWGSSQQCNGQWGNDQPDSGSGDRFARTDEYYDDNRDRRYYDGHDDPRRGRIPGERQHGEGHAYRASGGGNSGSDPRRPPRGRDEGRAEGANAPKRPPYDAPGGATDGGAAAPQKKAKADPPAVASAAAAHGSPLSAAAGTANGSEDVGLPETEAAQERAYQDSLRDINKSTCYVSKQAFQVPMGWNNKKIAAVKATLDRLSIIQRNTNDDSDDDSSSEDGYPPPPGARRQVTKVGLDRAERDFVAALPYCVPLNAGFNVLRHGASDICYCPCGINLEPWRKKHGVSSLCGDGHDKRSSCRKKFAPNDLMDHLKMEGGEYEETERRKIVRRPLRDICHHATRVYLEFLYKDWFGPNFSHKGLHPPLSKPFMRGQDEEMRRQEEALVIAARTIRQNAVEKEALEKERKRFKELARDAQKKVEELQAIREKFAIAEKVEEEELTEARVAKYTKLTALNFDMMTQVTGQLEEAVKIEVLEDSAGSGPSGGGFRLQDFFNSLWEKKSGDAHAALFGNNTGGNKIAKLILSEWNIVYAKQEVYAFKRQEDAWAQKEEDTGVDEGGPSRQFITDVFKQLGSLSVCSELGKDGKDCVKLFENTSSGVAVVTDDALDHGISSAVKVHAAAQAESKPSECLRENILEQAKGYVRAIGRIMLHTFAHRQTLPSNALPPFFLHVMLRGYDDDYDNNDILEHITMLDVPGESTLEWLLNKDSGERDKHGEEWNRDSFFADYIPSAFIYTRQVLLGSLRDGLSDFQNKIGTLDGDDLVKGCGLSSFFSVVPLNAIQRMYFARPEISITDLLGCLQPKFGEGEPTAPLVVSEQDKARLAEDQRIFYHGNFKKYLEESAHEDDSFLVRFVECATGSNYLPYDEDFKITIEFNFSLDPVGYPNFHSCTMDVVLPGFEAFFGDYDTFKEEKMNFAIKEVYNQFQMK